MTTRERQITLGQGDFAQQLMRPHQVAASFQQPAQFVNGDVYFAYVEHLLHFFEIFLPLLSAVRMHQLPLALRTVGANLDLGAPAIVRRGVLGILGRAVEPLSTWFLSGRQTNDSR